MSNSEYSDSEYSDPDSGQTTPRPNRLDHPIELIEEESLLESCTIFNKQLRENVTQIQDAVNAKKVEEEEAEKLLKKHEAYASCVRCRLEELIDKTTKRKNKWSPCDPTLEERATEFISRAVEQIAEAEKLWRMCEETSRIFDVELQQKKDPRCWG